MYGLPPDISYGLQCAWEGLDITEDVMIFYYDFNDFVDLAKLSDNYNHPSNHRTIRDSLRKFARDVYLRPYNQWFHTKAGNDQKVWCVARAGDSYSRKAAEAIDYLLLHYISDALEAKVDPKKSANQEQWLNRSNEFRHYTKISASLAGKLDLVPRDDLFHALHHPEDFSLRFPPREEIRLQTIGNLSDLASEIYIDDVNVVDIRNVNIKAERKRKRKVLAKSAQFLRDLVGGETARLFIGGDRVEIEGRRFLFSIKVQRMYADSHGALDIAVLEKKSKDRLCNLCWYVEKTPAIDQVSAMILAVQTGREDEILKIGNAFSLEHDAILRHSHVHDVIPVPHKYPSSETYFDDDDRMLHLTPGSHDFWQNNPRVYLDFAERCKSYLTRRFSSEFLPRFEPAPPQSVRRFLPDGTVSRQLLYLI